VADAPKGKEKETMKDKARPPSEVMESFASAMRHIISVPKKEIDRRAKVWAANKRRRSRVKAKTR
jgi:hypothetical protein